MNRDRAPSSTLLPLTQASHCLPELMRQQQGFAALLLPLLAGKSSSSSSSSSRQKVS
jgi:hypothetical protein